MVTRRQVQIPETDVVGWWQALTKQAEKDGERVVVLHAVVHKFVTEEAMERVPWFVRHGHPTEIISEKTEVWIESKE